MTKETIITISVPLLVAFSGYLAKYLNDLRIAQRKDRLERVNQQLRDLYGPLFSLIKAATITWEAFREKYCSRDDFQVEWHVVGVGGSRRGIMPQSEETKRIWRHWMQNVFMPLNAEMAQLIIDHSDLLEEEDMPECLLLLSAHVHGYKGILAAWQKEDYSEHMSLTSFPAMEILPYVESSYRKLKARQARLLGKPN
jgi:hypothetical protein